MIEFPKLFTIRTTHGRGDIVFTVVDVKKYYLVLWPIGDTGQWKSAEYSIRTVQRMVQEGTWVMTDDDPIMEVAR